MVNEKRNKKRCPSLDAPDRAFAGTFVFRNNPPLPYPEKVYQEAREQTGYIAVHGPDHTCIQFGDS